MIPKLRRALTIIVVFYGGAALIAVVITHAMLDGTSWTERTNPPRRITPASPPAPSPSKARPIGRPSELVGTCAIPTATSVLRVLCGTPGALTVMGTTRRDAGLRKPCKTTAFTRMVRTYGAHYLCLGKN